MSSAFGDFCLARDHFANPLLVDESAGEQAIDRESRAGGPTSRL
jgi:hypothetical protein